jgi:hypothetical protein
MDLALPGASGIEPMRRMLAREPHAHNGDTVNELFLGIGAPRGVCVSMRYAWK